MKFLGFDPGALVRIGNSEDLSEVTLHRCDDGRVLLTGEMDDGGTFSVLCRGDFLDEVVAQARASEQSAA